MWRPSLIPLEAALVLIANYDDVLREFEKNLKGTIFRGYSIFLIGLNIIQILPLTFTDGVYAIVARAPSRAAIVASSMFGSCDRVSRP